MKVGLFYSSDTGNTETVAEIMREKIGVKPFEVALT
jgi:flavodoxin